MGSGEGCSGGSDERVRLRWTQLARSDLYKAPDGWVNQKSGQSWSVSVGCHTAMPYIIMIRSLGPDRRPDVLR